MRENVFLRDTALPNIDPRDGRCIEIVATGLPIAQGIPVAVDATLVSPLRSDGQPFPRADWQPGASFSRAEQQKRNTYLELVDSPVLQLITVASETGGRINRQAVQLLTDAAISRARSEPVVLRSSAARSWRTRWLTMISVCIQDALAATLVNDGIGLLDAPDGPAPLAVDVWLNAGAEHGRSEAEADAWLGAEQEGVRSLDRPPSLVGDYFLNPVAPNMDG